MRTVPEILLTGSSEQDRLEEIIELINDYD